MGQIFLDPDQALAPGLDVGLAADGAERGVEAMASKAAGRTTDLRSGSADTERPVLSGARIVVVAANVVAVVAALLCLYIAARSG